MGVYTMSSVQKPFWLTIIWSYTIQYVRDCRNPVTRKSVLDHLETVRSKGQQMVLNTEFYMVCAPEING